MIFSKLVNAHGKLVYLTLAEPRHAQKVLDAWDEAVAPKAWWHEKPCDLGEEKAYLELNYHSRHDHLFLIRCVDTEDIIGTIGLHNMDAHGNIARLGMMTLTSDARPSGQEEETVRLMLRLACSYLNTCDVYMEVLRHDLETQKILEKIGFVQSAPYIIRRRDHSGRMLEKIYMDFGIQSSQPKKC